MALDSMANAEEYDEDYFFEQKVYKPKTPEIDEEALVDFDMQNHSIVGLIDTTNDKIDLSAESKPVSSVIKPIYGVSYTENILEGGSTNARLGGDSFYDTPGR